MTVSTARLAVLAMIVWTVALAILSAHADARPIEARSVTLSDAYRAPSWIAVVRPHRSAAPPVDRVYGAPCVDRHGDGGYFSDLGAYRGTGGALPAQRRTGLIIRWGRVSYNGVTFHNGYAHRSVLVAGWCERGVVR